MHFSRVPSFKPKPKEKRIVPFDSTVFDALADEMGASAYLPTNRHKRYFSVKGLQGAATVRKKVYIDRDLLGQLSEGQSLAIVAHEFIHLRSRDGRYRFRHLTLPIYLAILAFLFLPGVIARFTRIPPVFGSVWVLLLITLGVWIYGLWVLLVVTNAKTFRNQETRCDLEALQFVTGEDLIAALAKADSMTTSKERRRWRYRILSRTYPPLEERFHKIRQSGVPAPT